MVLMIVVMVMMMPVLLIVVMHVVGVFLLAVHKYMDVRAGDAALFTGQALKARPGQAQAVHAVDKGPGIVHQIGQRGHQHVPRRAHVAFDV